MSANGLSGRLVLVRHAAPAIRPEQPASQWHLSAEGRAGAEALAQEPYWAGLVALYASPEPKATATAQRIAALHALPIRIEPDLHEVKRDAWVEGGIQDMTRRYLAGEPIAGWEAKEAALDRVRSCIDGILARCEGGSVGIVSHGLVLTLYLTDLLGLDGPSAYALWSRLRFPDVGLVDPAARRFEWGFGTGEAAYSQSGRPQQ